MFSSISISSLLLIAWAATLVSAVALPHDHHHDHTPTRTRLPTEWFQPDNHHAHSLFKRGPPTDGVDYADVGSPEWRAAYPQSTPDPNALPKAWVDALNAAVSAGKIPNIPNSNPTSGNPVYPNNLDPNSDQVCSSTYKCRKNTDVIWDAPDGVFGISFDDGPQPAGDALYQFLQQNNEHATHFFIGVNILNNPNQFMRAYSGLGDDIAVHTWTHPHMTTLGNLDVLGQLGWTMEIIHNSTGGRLPRYWRPPYGDSDNRVAAIAKEVFGLTTVIWNQDTEDWSIPSGGTTLQAVQASMTKWLTGPKSPGLIILEHELYNQTVQAFMNAYPLIKSNGWKTESVAKLFGDSYQNSADSNSAVNPVNGILVNSPSGSSAESSTDSPTPTASTSGNNLSAPSPTSGDSGAALQQNNGALPLLRVPTSVLVAGFFAILSSNLI